MKESELYIGFIKRNILLLVLPVAACLIISTYFYSRVPSRTKIYQEYKLAYNSDNADTLTALTDQAVAELRAQRFEKAFENSAVKIYKSAPFVISIDAISQERETSYALLLKEAEYLRQNFQTAELSSPQIAQIEPNIFKYELSGLIIGLLLGLTASLILEYLRNY